MLVAVVAIGGEGSVEDMHRDDHSDETRLDWTKHDKIGYAYRSATY